MNPKPVALPRPPHVEAAAIMMFRTSAEPEKPLQDMLRRREVLSLELGRLDAEIERYAYESLCGVDDTQDVELYDGTLGVTREFVDRYEPPIGQLQWLDDLHQRFNGSNESPGNVTGVRWGSGGLFTNDMFITAGHCFDQYGGGWQRPSRNGITVESAEIATLMRVNFNFQINGQTKQERLGESFPVEALLEYRSGGLDFAIVRLGRNASGKLPGEIYGTFQFAEQDVTQSGAMLCLIQHPSGRPKKVEAGSMLHNKAGQIAYNSLDTEGGSSGSPILTTDGRIVGVHTNGGCSYFSGFNYGVTIGAIRAASSVIS
ncbi:trypsin-like serine peptidase [Candidatus Electronema sp. TJ]|uniref:trypsin-like serine peptidase n=1 Tax=Candidatus Electronema sp. TJ TaxID=3401573 RepID=UPI003AA8667C